MSYYNWRGFCLCGTEDIPPDAAAADAPFAPLVILVRRDPLTSRGLYAIERPEELSEQPGPASLLPCTAAAPELPEATAALVRAIDYCGVRSGRDESKFEAMHLTALAASQVSCPLVGESPVNLECRVTDIVKLGGSHDMFIADIVAVNVDEELLDEKGRLRLAKAGLCTYAHGEYFALGKKIGDFGFSVKKKKKKPQYDRRK